MFQSLSLSLNVLRIHSDKIWPLAFAAASMAFKSSVVMRTGTIRPFASPLGSLGRPTFLGILRNNVTALIADPPRETVPEET